LVQSRRSAAAAHLMDIAQSQQRYLLDARAFAPDMTTLNVTTPSSVSPTHHRDCNDRRPSTFAATATPVGTSQASDVGKYRSSGRQTPTGARQIGHEHACEPRLTCHRMRGCIAQWFRFFDGTGGGCRHCRHIGGARPFASN
jgi:Tfp pilus assembly protein PilE